MGNETAAIGDLEMLVERVDPEFSNGWYRLANLYQHAGRPADAAKALAKFHAIKTAQTDRDGVPQEAFSFRTGCGGWQ